MKNQALSIGLDHIMANHSHFSQRDLLRAVAEEAPERGLGIDDIRTVVQDALKHPDIISLGRKQSDIRYSTREMVDLETQMIEQVID